MKRSADWAKVIANIKPLDIAAYLQSRDWALSEEEPGRFSIWTKTSADAEVLLPDSSRYRDFENRIADIVQTLESVEQRDENAILTDLSFPSADFIRIRLAPDLGTPTMPFSSAVSALEAARALVLAAARSAVDPRNSYQGPPPAEASEYLRRAQFGHTERGSFVFTILSPIEGTQTGVKPEPFSRRVVRFLVSGVSATKDAAQDFLKTKTFAGFESRIAAGVSANLCEAITQLSQASNDNAIELAVSWSRRIETPANVVHQPLVIPSNLINSIALARDALRSALPEANVEVLGSVYRLQRGATPDDLRDEVRLNGIVDEHPRQVALKLSDEMRIAAIRAFEERKLVRCIGTLDRKTKPYTLYDIRVFEPIEPEDKSIPLT